MSDTRIGMCKICPACCPIEVTIEQGRAVSIAGDRQSPSYGGYTCPKGRAMPDAHYGPQRLLHSQRRTAEGSFAPITSDAAIDEVAAKLRAIIDEHGPDSIGLLVGSGLAANPMNAAVSAAFMMALGTFDERFYSVMTIDQPGKVMAQALHGRWLPGPQRFRDSDVWVMVGANPVVSKMGLEQNPAMAIKQAIKRGMKLIMIDPRATETGRNAFLHLQPQPGQDATLLAGFLHIILSEQRYDTAFVAENTQGIEPLARAVARFTPEHVAAITGVPAEQILLAARTFAEAERGCIITGTGPHFALHGTLVEYLALCINTVCGRWTRAGEDNAHPHVVLPEVEVRAQPLAPYVPWDDSVRCRINNLPKTISGAPCGTLADEILTPGNGQIRALICAGSNPMVALPGQARTEQALESLDLLVSMDVELSNTARMADYILADRMALETPGITQYTESVKYYGVWTHAYEEPYAHYSPAVVEPPEGSDVLEVWQFIYEIARKLGLSLTLYANPAGFGEHWEKLPVAVPMPMDKRPSSEELMEMLCAGSRVPLAEIKSHAHGHLYDALDNVVLPRDPACTTRLELADIRMMSELDTVFTENGATAAPSADFPLLFTSRRSSLMYNSIGRLNPMQGGRQGYNPAFLNPADLERHGLRTGDLIRIRSRHGEVIGIAEAEAGLRPGTLSMSHGFGVNPGEAADPIGQGACTSALMDANAEYDPLFGQPRMSAIPVAISALAA